MASNQAIGALAQRAEQMLTAEMNQQAAMLGIDAPTLPTDKDLRLQAAKRLEALALFLARANGILAAKLAEKQLLVPATKAGKEAK